MDIMYCTSSFSEVKSPIEAPLRRANRFLTIASAFALERTWVYQFQTLLHEGPVRTLYLGYSFIQKENVIKNYQFCRNCPFQRLSKYVSSIIGPVLLHEETGVFEENLIWFGGLESNWKNSSHMRLGHGENC
jgi:hypothetical protein